MQEFQAFPMYNVQPMKAYVVIDRVPIPPRGLELNLIFVLVEWLGNQIGYGPFAVPIRYKDSGMLLSFILLNSMPLARTWAMRIFPDVYDSGKYSDWVDLVSKAGKVDWETLSGAPGYVDLHQRNEMIDGEG